MDGQRVEALRCRSLASTTTVHGGEKFVLLGSHSASEVRKEESVRAGLHVKCK